VKIIQEDECLLQIVHVQRIGARVQIALPIPTATVRPNPIRTCTSAKAVTNAPLFLADDPEGPGVLEAGVVGVNTPDGLEMHELAAEFAAETVVGAFGFTVPFPAKLHASALRCCDS
jgi:hypothetical protein